MKIGRNTKIDLPTQNNETCILFVVSRILNLEVIVVFKSYVDGSLVIAELWNLSTMWHQIHSKLFDGCRMVQNYIWLEAQLITW